MLKSFIYAFRGIAKAFSTQLNMIVHSILLILVIIAGFYFCISVHEWIAIIICSGMVFSAEIMNTAIEETVNFISPDRHPKAGLIKDLSAGAVLIAAIASIIVAAFIFVPKL